MQEGMKREIGKTHTFGGGTLSSDTIQLRVFFDIPFAPSPYLKANADVMESCPSRRNHDPRTALSNPMQQSFAWLPQV